MNPHGHHVENKNGELSAGSVVFLSMAGNLDSRLTLTIVQAKITCAAISSLPNFQMQQDLLKNVTH